MSTAQISIGSDARIYGVAHRVAPQNIVSRIDDAVVVVVAVRVVRRILLNHLQERAVVNIEVDVAADAWDAAGARVLPKLVTRPGSILISW